MTAPTPDEITELRRVLEQRYAVPDFNGWLRTVEAMANRVPSLLAVAEAVQRVRAVNAVGPSVRRKAIDEGEQFIGAFDAVSFEYGWLRAMETVLAALDGDSE